MKLSFSHRLQSESDVWAIQSLEDHGFGCCELFFPEREPIDAQTLKLVEEVSGTTSLTLTAHLPYKNINIASVYQYVRESSIELFIEMIDSLSDYVRLVTLHTGYASPSVSGGLEKAIENNVLSLAKICGHAGQYDIVVGVENAMNEKYMVGRNVQEMMQIIKRVNRGNVGLTFDVGHAMLTGNVEDYVNMKEYVVEVHLHDNFGYTDEHLGLGQGKIDWGYVYRHVKDLDCPLVLEQRTIEETMESLKYWQGLSSESSPYYRLNKLIGEIRSEKDPRHLLPINNEMIRLCENVLALGGTGSSINHIVSSCREAMAFSVAELVLEEMKYSMGPPRHRFALMAVGSFGREEMSVESDQDTILVLDDTVDDGGRTFFKMFSESLVSRLSAAGFPRCRGNMMASNPKWRGTITELLARLDTTYERSVIMDARFIFGDRPLANRFLKTLHYTLNTDPTYAMELAISAIKADVGLEGDSFRLEYFAGSEDAFNIKRYGFRIFSQAIKALSVKYHITRTNIADRLWKMYDLGVIDRKSIDRYIFAYDQLSRVMMLGYVQNIQRGIVSNEYIFPFSLSRKDREGLKEALRIVRDLQGLCSSQFAIARTML
ncbi:putative signal-transduction protein [Methanocella conradii HZ254]|uniref:Signal-transduction protein n=1 Tax=Methanocella conradii (strain DSM 24694 / JCM 17849 / CGMCC 1.5162 / HZ254) TaxID=1041930 RepID=H8IAU6_METCZ|nr:TIM barrel protein [Methanocella conradii]AFD00601.1 putative signal-transduction protein [Methanocella conradii HZ254]